MPVYYFDFFDANGFTQDNAGYDLPDLAAVQWEAVLSLVDQSRDNSTTSLKFLNDLEIDVRDDAGPVMRVSFKLELELRPRQQSLLDNKRPPGGSFGNSDRDVG